MLEGQLGADMAPRSLRPTIVVGPCLPQTSHQSHERRIEERPPPPDGVDLHLLRYQRVVQLDHHVREVDDGRLP
jgi:hypothetical protein